MIKLIQRRFEQNLDVVRKSAEVLGQPIADAAEMIIDCYGRDGGVFIFGNGGSACDAQHIACELVGRFMSERKGLKAQALTADTAILTAVTNDYEFNRIFARQLEACARQGDVAIGLSTSGSSANVIAGLEEARNIGMQTIVFTGKGGGRCKELADVAIDVPCDLTPRIQEVHLIAYHTLCELVEQAFLNGPAVD
ncbi:MAG: SIS domain-containing protein [Phycisphaerae bacterium]